MQPRACRPRATVVRRSGRAAETAVRAAPLRASAAHHRQRDDEREESDEHVEERDEHPEVLGVLELLRRALDGAVQRELAAFLPPSWSVAMVLVACPRRRVRSPCGLVRSSRYGLDRGVGRRQRRSRRDVLVSPEEAERCERRAKPLGSRSRGPRAAGTKIPPQPSKARVTALGITSLVLSRSTSFHPACLSGWWLARWR
jgi:hypothetical protein